MPKAEPWRNAVTMMTRGAPGMGLLGCQKSWREPPSLRKTSSQPQEHKTPHEGWWEKP